jgi:hypothetical protein
VGDVTANALSYHDARHVFPDAPATAPSQSSYNHPNLDMGRRDRLISTSILRAIFRSDAPRKDENARPGLFARIWAFFAIFSLSLARYRASLFKKLRNDVWDIEEEGYTESFRSPSKSKRTDLVAIGDLGYSGSVCKNRQAS